MRDHGGGAAEVRRGNFRCRHPQRRQRARCSNELPPPGAVDRTATPDAAGARTVTDLLSVSLVAGCLH